MLSPVSLKVETSVRENMGGLITFPYHINEWLFEHPRTTLRNLLRKYIKLRRI